MPEISELHGTYEPIINQEIITDSYIYISHLDEDYKFWRLPTDPDTVSDSMQSNFTNTNALGRSAPVYTYSNSGPRQVQIDLSFPRDAMNDLNMDWSNEKLGYGEDYVDNFLRAIQAIALPKYNLNNMAVEPPLIAVRLGSQLFIKGIVTGAVGIAYDKPILMNGKYSQIKISFTVSEVDPYDSTTVFKNGSYRGMVKTIKDGALKNIGVKEK